MFDFFNYTYDCNYRLFQQAEERSPADCTARIQPDLVGEGDAITDISGFYYDWSNEASAMIGNNTAQVKWTKLVTLANAVYLEPSN